MAPERYSRRLPAGAGDADPNLPRASGAGAPLPLSPAAAIHCIWDARPMPAIRQPAHNPELERAAPLFGGPVEQDPDGKVVGDVLEAMRNMRGAIEKIAGPDIVHSVLDPITRCPSRNKVELVPLMWDLWAIRWPSSESDLEIAINEYLGRSPRCSRQAERSRK